MNSRIPLSDSGVLVLLFSVVVAAEARGVTLKFEKVLRFSRLPQRILRKFYALAIEALRIAKLSQTEVLGNRIVRSPCDHKVKVAGRRTLYDRVFREASSENVVHKVTTRFKKNL